MPITHLKKGDPLPDWDPLSRGPSIQFGTTLHPSATSSSPSDSLTPEQERGLAEQLAWEKHRASQRRPKAPNKT